MSSPTPRSSFFLRHVRRGLRVRGRAPAGAGDVGLLLLRSGLVVHGLTRHAASLRAAAAVQQPYNLAVLVINY